MNIKNSIIACGLVMMILSNATAATALEADIATPETSSVETLADLGGITTPESAGELIASEDSGEPITPEVVDTTEDSLEPLPEEEIITPESAQIEPELVHEYHYEDDKVRVTVYSMTGIPAEVTFSAFEITEESFPETYEKLMSYVPEGSNILLYHFSFELNGEEFIPEDVQIQIEFLNGIFEDKEVSVFNFENGMKEIESESTENGVKFNI